MQAEALNQSAEDETSCSPFGRRGQVSAFRDPSVALTGVPSFITHVQLAMHVRCSCSSFECFSPLLLYTNTVSSLDVDLFHGISPLMRLCSLHTITLGIRLKGADCLGTHQLQLATYSQGYSVIGIPGIMRNEFPAQVCLSPINLRYLVPFAQGTLDGLLLRHATKRKALLQATVLD